MKHSYLDLPRISELGTDLLEVSLCRKIFNLSLPFIYFFLYFFFAMNGFWLLALLSTIGLSFVSYGSISHDLVHASLRLPRRLNDFLLFAIELMCIRSGHAYRISHLHHHKVYPSDSDIEGAAAKMSFFRALIEGIILQGKLYFWALKNVKNKTEKYWIIFEGILILFLILISIFNLTIYSSLIIYISFMIAGSWIIPVITSYIPHNPQGDNILLQTKLFRGKFLDFIFIQHLYHLEHHLYPQVPHMNWTILAKRLDPFFDKMNLQKIVIWK